MRTKFHKSFGKLISYAQVHKNKGFFFTSLNIPHSWITEIKKYPFFHLISSTCKREKLEKKKAKAEYKKRKKEEVEKQKKLEHDKNVYQQEKINKEHKLKNKNNDEEEDLELGETNI